MAINPKKKDVEKAQLHETVSVVVRTRQRIGSETLITIYGSSQALTKCWAGSH